MYVSVFAAVMANKAIYNLYCVGAVVKSCSINQSTEYKGHATRPFGSGARRNV